MQSLRDLGYVTDDLAAGNTKYMGVCKLPGPDRLRRRIDVRRLGPLGGAPWGPTAGCLLERWARTPKQLGARTRGAYPRRTVPPRRATRARAQRQGDHARKGTGGGAC